MRVAILTSDGREVTRSYSGTQPSFGTAPEALLQGMAAMPGLEVHVICCLQQKVMSPEKLASNIWFHSLHVPKTGWLRTGYRGCIRAVREKLKEIKPEIVHGQGTERDCAISAVFSGFPNVLTIHGNMRMIAKVNQARPFSYGWLAAKLEAITLPRSNGVICITNYTRTAVANLVKRTWLVPNAVDAEFFALERARDIPPVLLCVGNISIVKNQNNFIRALETMPDVEKFRVIFLGMADSKRAYDREFFNLLATRPWCSYEGFADRTKLKEFYKKAEMLVLPSLEDNCPMAVIEAMAAGVPVIAAKVGGVPDLIENEKTGLFCEPLNPSTVRTAVEKILHYPETGEEMAKRAKKSAWQRFHPKVIAQQHLQIYEEVLRIAS